MSSKTRVSKQVKVTQGKGTITFELLDGKLVIEHAGGATEYFKFTLREPGIDALIELLMLNRDVKMLQSKPTVPPPSDELERRFTREGDDQPPDEAPVEDSGLSKPPGEAEAGMD
jgi:hypothetical protein